MKFSGPVQLRTSNFWARVSGQLASRIWPLADKSLFLDNLYPPRVFILQGHDITGWKPKG